ncbi:hypothetical protein COV04_03085 [Candidatus Uhrbacteria bacterium CG10_big_fil_rev_8_21_14_0_10_48_11]|uniref:Uncharacterized protein n=1 Tax=Candidatus Uhrbacteria bacterium CG10_big_fil_rev_8_21_14_0_10_48_11 TaxID=1975037 RepID=A0A2M8LEL6_9BACT|nr:MAG: hypothetical protein COV04_03085 [Candidatus Uhrbacteria bacterium CG10_big_fil_rev_8_21_14_0_10_48_11]
MLFSFFNPFVLGYFILPAVVFGSLVGVVIYRKRETTIRKKVHNTAIIFAALVFLSFAFYTVYLILVSTNSTRILGIVNIPLSGLPLALFAYVVEWAIATLLLTRTWFNGNIDDHPTRLKMITLVILTLFVVVGVVECYRFTNIERVRAATRPDEIVKLYHSPLSGYDSVLLSAVAANENTLSDILGDLAKDNRLRILHNVARNPQTPMESLRLLYEHNSTNQNGDGYVAYDLAVNPSTPIDILLVLSKSEDEIVRSNLTFNPNLPADILCALREDSKQIVVMEAKRNLKQRDVACP